MRACPWFWLACIASVSGCQQVAPSVGSKQPDAPPVESQEPHRTPDEHGSQAFVPAIEQRGGPFTSTTAASTSPCIGFVVSSASVESATALSSRLKAALAFENESTKSRVGTFTKLGPMPWAVGRGGGVPEAATEFLEICAASLLTADQWYVLQFPKDDSYVLRLLDSPRGLREVRLYTGSAPSLRYVYATGAAKGSETHIYVNLTEPVRLGDLATSDFAIVAGGRLLSGCVVYGSECVTSQTDLRLSGFNFRVNQSLDVKTIEKLSLPLNLKGHTRTTGEAKSLLGRGSTLPGTTTVDFVPNGNWQTCFNDELSCWFVQ